MSVSVIIPTWNEEEHLSRLLNDLNEQSFQDFEVIVADRSSSDKTVEVARKYGAKIVKGGKVSFGRNAGAAVARGQTFLFLDADATLPSKDFLKDVVGEMHERRLDLAGTAVIPDSSKILDGILHWLYNRYIYLMGAILPHAAGTCILAKKSIHEAVGGFDETITLAEDHDYVRRGAQFGQFGIIKSHPIITGVRRLEKEGRILLSLKYIFAEFYILMFGPIRGKYFKHEFGYKKEKK
ncbi:glycosyltransferase [Candidatus Uhrbacteria bacterium]|nr:glycosyltransferase [Candidatus Uhrbacteria bacterium]